MEDKILKDKLEEAKEANLNLRFDNVEKQLFEIKEILKGDIKDLKIGVATLEDYQRHCPINLVKGDVMRYSKETIFIRNFFKSPWKVFVGLTFYIIIIVTFVLVFGPRIVFELLLKMKGL